MISFKLTIRKDKQKADKTWTVFIQIIYQRKRKYIPTTMSVSKKDLTPSCKIKNQEIMKRGEELISVLQKRANDLNLEINDYDIDNVVKLITAKAKNHTVSFSDYAEKWIEQCERKGVKNYKTALNRFYAFLGKKSVLFGDITVDTLKGFELYLSDKPRAKSLYINSIVKIFDDGRNFYNDEDNGVIVVKHTLKKYDAPKQNISAKRALPLGKILDIINLPYKNELTVRGNICVRDLAKDCFMLSFFLMGMNTADLYNATDFDGEHITYQRTKTKDRRADKAEISVKVHPFIRGIVEKYRSDKGKVFDFSQRYATEARLNRYVNLGLKEIGKEIGVDNLQFYAARHSMATIAVNEAGINMYVVNDMLNHIAPEMRVTKLYIKRDYTVINNANYKLIDYVLSKLRAS